MKFYDKIAKYYDLIFNINYKEEASLINAIFKMHGISGTLLDLGCGTAGHLVELSKKGWIVEGLDNSKEMIKIAKQKLPNAKFYLQKMEKFKTNKKYDAIIIFNRSLIHLKNEKSLFSLFNKINEHLKIGGGVLIDLDIHKYYFADDFSNTGYFHKENVEGSITEDFDFKNNKVLWSVNLSISDENKLYRVVDQKEFLLIDPLEVSSFFKKLKYDVFFYSTKGRIVKNLNKHLLVLCIKNR